MLRERNILLMDSHIISCMNTKNPREVLSSNIKLLMSIHKLDQKELAKKSGISQKTISNMVTMSNSASLDNIDNIEKAANAFKVPAWILLIPKLSHELLTNNALPALVENYLNGSDEGRDYISHVAEKESKYTV